MLSMIESARDALRRRYDVLCERQAPSVKERLELSDLARALQRIENNAYGRCERCDGPIGRHRLRTLPETTRCAECSY